MESSRGFTLLIGALAGAFFTFLSYLITQINDYSWIFLGCISMLLGMSLSASLDHWYTLSTIDDATKLFNRRYLFRRIKQELRYAQRVNKPLSFIVAEVDDMRFYNNTYGHIAGDLVLTTIAQKLRSGVRRGDIVARWGGDEFGIILPNTDSKDAAIIAERLRTLIDSLRIELADQTPVSVTISAGVASLHQGPDNAEALIKNADMAMYRAKQRKNHVVLAQ